MTECQAEGGHLVGRQSLEVRRRDCDPVTIKEFPAMTFPDPIGLGFTLCKLFGDHRAGWASAVVGVFQRLGVSPDGSRIVFELNDGFSLLAQPILSPEEKGFFVVRANGRHPHWVAPPSGEMTYRVSGTPTGPVSNVESYIPFSPDGRKIAFIDDLDPDPNVEDAQVKVLELETGVVRQVTHLLAGPDPARFVRRTNTPYFLDNDTIVFLTYANPDGNHPDGTLFQVQSDGSGLRPLEVPEPVRLPSSPIVPMFEVARPLSNLIDHLTVRSSGGEEQIVPEVFRFNGSQLLQLTNFDRADTASLFLSADRRRAFFLASANRFGTNETENCQLFSIGAFGGGLRQLTRFEDATGTTAGGCGAGGLPPGCTFWSVEQDPITQTLILDSTCDPLDADPFPRNANPYGNQVFAMRPNGTGLRQLTWARGCHPAAAGGCELSADGSVDVQLPGPVAYSALIH